MFQNPPKSGTPADESGQSLVELAVGAPFLIFLILGVIEMGLVLAVYISLINAAREGASFASKYPQLSNSSHYSDTYTCASASCPTLGEEYENRVKNEVYYEPGDSLVARQLIENLDPNKIDIQVPVITNGSIDKGSPITVTVVYSVQTFTSQISLPFFGRFGLPNVYRLQYSMSMPIR